jgi:hypothetical protein
VLSSQPRRGPAKSDPHIEHRRARFDREVSGEVFEKRWIAGAAARRDDRILDPDLLNRVDDPPRVVTELGLKATAAHGAIVCAMAFCLQPAFLLRR